jgi:hypothetical protein
MVKMYTVRSQQFRGGVCVFSLQPNATVYAKWTSRDRSLVDVNDAALCKEENDDWESWVTMSLVTVIHIS